MARSPAAELLDPAAATLRQSPIELPGEARILSPDQLKPNTWNPNVQDDETYFKEKVSIRRFGFVVPIIVRPHPDEPGIFQIIDGEHRLKAGLELGMTAFPCYDIGPVSDREAMQLTIVLNELRGKPEQEKLGEILKTLLATETLDSLTEVLPYSKEEVGKIAKLPDFDWEGFKERNRQVDSERMVERIFRLPAEANSKLNEALGQVKGDQTMSDSDALTALVEDYLA